MTIPHLDRTLTHVDRTVVAVPPRTVFRALTDLADLLSDCEEIRLESWPEGGLGAPDAAFWAVHWASALEQAADDLRSAIRSVEALEGARKGSRTRRRRSAPKKPRPTVTPDDLVGALRELGGTATVEQLVDRLGLPDGRSLNGARRIAVDAGTVAYEDRTYSLSGT